MGHMKQRDMSHHVLFMLLYARWDRRKVDKEEMSNILLLQYKIPYSTDNTQR